MAGLLLLRDNFGYSYEDVDGEQPDAILVVARQMLKEWYHLLDDYRRRHRLDKLCQVVGRLSAHHGCLIVHELAELLSQSLLGWRSGARVGHVVQAGGGYLRREPVCFREADGERDEKVFDLLLRELLADLVQRFDGLEAISDYRIRGSCD